MFYVIIVLSHGFHHSSLLFAIAAVSDCRLLFLFVIAVLAVLAVLAVCYCETIIFTLPKNELAAICCDAGVCGDYHQLD